MVYGQKPNDLKNSLVIRIKQINQVRTFCKSKILENKLKHDLLIFMAEDGKNTKPKREV